MSDFKPGDIVDIAITRVRVTEYHHDPDDLPEITVYFECEAGGQFIRLPHHWPMVTVERVAPEVRPGDLWRDRDGTLWFGVESDNGHADLVCSAVEAYAVGEVHEKWGPLTLVRREGGETS